MNTHLRNTIRAGMAVGMFVLAGCATERATQDVSSRTSVQRSSTQETAAQESPAGETNPLACPLDLRDALKGFCEFFNEGKSENETLDYILLTNIVDPTPLAVCGCPQVSVCPPDPDEDCPPLKGRDFVGHRVIFGATVEGSCCEDICTASNGGTAKERRECVRTCKESGFCG